MKVPFTAACKEISSPPSAIKLDTNKSVIKCCPWLILLQFQSEKWILFKIFLDNKSIFLILEKKMLILKKSYAKFKKNTDTLTIL